MICMDNGGREGSGLLDHFKMNMPYKADVTYMSRRDAARRYGIVEAPNNIDNIQFIHTVLDSSFVDTHFIFDECPIYSKFNITGRNGRVFSYNWSQLKMPESLKMTATICIQPILYNKRDDSLQNKRIQVIPPKSGQHIQLYRQYRSSKTVSKVTQEIMAGSNVQVIDINGSDGHDILGPMMKSLVLEAKDETNQNLHRIVGFCLEKEFCKLRVKPDRLRFLYHNVREMDLANNIVAHMSDYGLSLDTIGSFLGCESEAVIAISESNADRVLEMLSRAKLIGYLIILPSSQVKEVIENLKTDIVEPLDMRRMFLKEYKPRDSDLIVHYTPGDDVEICLQDISEQVSGSATSNTLVVKGYRTRWRKLEQSNTVKHVHEYKEMYRNDHVLLEFHLEKWSDIGGTLLEVTKTTDGIVFLLSHGQASEFIKSIGIKSKTFFEHKSAKKVSALALEMNALEYGTGSKWNGIWPSLQSDKFKEDQFSKEAFIPNTSHLDFPQATIGQVLSSDDSPHQLLSPAQVVLLPNAELAQVYSTPLGSGTPGSANKKSDSNALRYNNLEDTLHSPDDSQHEANYCKNETFGEDCDSDSERMSDAGQDSLENRMGQAIDLLKLHLVSAVRTEIEELREKISKLEETMQLLSRENNFLRNHVDPNVLRWLPNPAHLGSQD